MNVGAQSPASACCSPTVVVVTGTDTGVGKTWATASLARAASAAGRRVVAIKPFETGCSSERDEKEDGVILAEASGQHAPTEALIRLRTPVAPPEAAEREGVVLDYIGVVRQLRALVIGSDLALIEGAGGLLSPLTWDRTVIDLARDLGARVLVVAQDRLGTISHTVSALKLLAWHDVRASGVMLIPPEHPDASTGSNARAIIRLTSAPVHLAVRSLDPAVGALSVKEVLGWFGL